MTILFVCTGNTCRSCMAEAIFNNMCTLDNITAISAGLAVAYDSKTSKHSAALVMENCSVDISERKAVQLTNDILKEADLILTMTSSMKEMLTSRFQSLSDKIFTLNEYVGVKDDVIDPYGGDVSIYEKTFDSLKQSITLLLENLKEDKSIF